MSSNGLKALLKGGTVIGTGPNEMQIERSLPHGHVAAALGMLRGIALDRLILSTAKDAASRRHCGLVVAMIVDRLITPRSKLGFVRAVDEETATSSLGAVLRLGEVKEREAYEALDWLLEPLISISARSATGPHRACAPTSSCACSPITSSGICATPWPRCCSTTLNALLQGQNAPPQSPVRNRRRQPKPRRPPSVPPTVSVSWASPAS